MARRKKRSGTALVDGNRAPSSDVGGPTPSKKRRCRARAVPSVQVPSRPDLSHANPTATTERDESASVTSANKDVCIESSTIIDPSPALNTPATITATSWSAYFREVGLLGSAINIADQFKKYTSAQLHSIKQNFGRFTSDNPGRLVPLAEYTTAFNLKHAIQNSKKAQPDEASIPDFEKLNEPTLKQITDSSCIIRDNSGEPLVVKVGSMPMYGRRLTQPPAIPLRLTAALFHSTLQYLCTAACTQDAVRHAGKRDTTSRPPDKVDRGGPNPRPPIDLGQCHHIHLQHCARNDNEIENIQLFRGPKDTWEGRARDGPINIFLHQVLPLTQLLHVIFRTVLKDCWEKYDKVRQKMPLSSLEHCLGIWRSRAIVIESMTNVHRDLQDVCYGWCAIVPLGDFCGGDVCLPGLGFKVTLPVGSVLFLRSYIVPHYVGGWSGHRFSIVHFSHQSTFDYFTQQSNGEFLHSFGDMPWWWQANRSEKI